MAGYIFRRFLQAIPVFFGTTLLIYYMTFAMPGDPIIAMFGQRTPNPAVVEQLRAQYHLDEPFIVQYFIYLGGIFRGDFGLSFSGEPISQVLARTFPVTAQLAMIAIVWCSRCVSSSERRDCRRSWRSARLRSTVIP